MNESRNVDGEGGNASEDTPKQQQQNRSKIGGGCGLQPPPGAMKIMSMNCRGVGQPEAVQEVCSFVQLCCPTLVFLSETRLFSDSVQSLKRELGLPNGLGVGSFGWGGGLALLWMHEICVQLQSYDNFHIDVVIVDQNSGEEQWRFTGFYGEARRERRYRSWELMHFLRVVPRGFVQGILMRLWMLKSNSEVLQDQKVRWMGFGMR